MAVSQAAAKVEYAMGHMPGAATKQDVSNPDNNPAWADVNDKMKALVWEGKNSVKVGQSNPGLTHPATRH